MILYSDVPLLKRTTIKQLINKANSSGFSLLSVLLEEPYGYGRIIRDSNGSIHSIVEQKDANQDQLKINEINTEILGDNMEINKYILGFKYLKNKTIIKKGITKKKDLSNVKKTKFVKEKNFNHCITVLLNLTPNLDNESIINLKICKNGSLQMTGCKEISHLDLCADIIINLINNIPNLIKKLPWVVIKDFKLEFEDEFEDDLLFVSPIIEFFISSLLAFP